MSLPVSHIFKHYCKFISMVRGCKHTQWGFIKALSPKPTFHHRTTESSLTCISAVFISFFFKPCFDLVSVKPKNFSWTDFTEWYVVFFFFYFITGGLHIWNQVLYGCSPCLWSLLGVWWTITGSSSLVHYHFGWISVFQIASVWMVLLGKLKSHPFIGWKCFNT